MGIIFNNPQSYKNSERWTARTSLHRALKTLTPQNIRYLKSLGFHCVKGGK